MKYIVLSIGMILSSCAYNQTVTQGEKSTSTSITVSPDVLSYVVTDKGVKVSKTSCK